MKEQNPVVPQAMAWPLAPDEENWSEVITPKTSLLDIRLHELWQYRDLVMMFVKRDFTASFKQTVLGPVWFLLQPLITSFTFLIIFNKVAKIETGIDPMVFYMAGITIWGYFSECLTKTATVFRENAGIFGKVYFPRLAMPVSIVISNLVKFGIQLFLFLLFWGYHLITDRNIHPNAAVFLLPVLVLIMGLMALGLGMIITALTTKYRDLALLLGFGVQLLMYATPVIMPISEMSEKYRWIILANPLSPIVETFRYGFTGAGTFSIGYLLYSVVFTLIVLILGILTFNRVEKSFTDTV